jgi:hypothetical protein
MWSGLGALGFEELGNLTSTAILGWYAWHTASKTLPELLRNFREELASGRETSQSHLDAFREELAEERAQRHADHLATTRVLEAVVERLG